jgi:hypothetical protein
MVEPAKALGFANICIQIRRDAMIRKHFDEPVVASSIDVMLGIGMSR